MITIAERLRPFSHRPGSICLIPGTSYLVEAFPALVRIKEFSGSLLKEIPLAAKGPLKQFTLMQDLERGCVKVFSEQYSFYVLPNLEISERKNPPLESFPKERLSLGSHRKQDIDSIRRRRDFREILPIWFRLGSFLKLPPRAEDNRGVFSLLEACYAARESSHPERLIPELEKLFLVGLSDFFVPRSFDEEWQGILPASTEISQDSPLYLLSEGAALIRSLFFLDGDHAISLLPNMPPECFSGRMIGLICQVGRIDLEWTKKMIRRVHLQAEKDGEIAFHLPSEVKTFRVREHLSESGKILSRGDSLAIKSGTHYLLDRFQK